MNPVQFGGIVSQVLVGAHQGPHRQHHPGLPQKLRTLDKF
jgi:hypothetical protein